MCVLFLNKQSG